MRNISSPTLPFPKSLQIVVHFVIALSLPLARAHAEPKPPAGFTALFNGKDLSGWHGMPHFDPRKLSAMTGGERAKNTAEWNEEFKKHWRVENGELVNDGKGPYATTDKEYGDIE